ncbi:Envelope glycoprotein [Lobulomyces angularis]|nr:Envelope glycoprotein [Lobulomyces angularis]
MPAVSPYIEIPTIDISGLYFQQSDPNYKLASKRLFNAVKEFGFANIINHNLLHSNQEKLNSESVKFFQDKDASVRNSVRRNEFTSRGFADNELTKQKLDNKMVFDFANPLTETPKSLDLQNYSEGINQWPKDREEFKNSCLTQFFDLDKLALIIFKALIFELNLDFDTVYKSLDLDFREAKMRLNYYPIEKDVSFGVYDHADPGLITLLWQQKSGLEAFHVKTQQWLKVNPIEGAFVLNIGDMFQVLSNNVLKAAIHRVKMDGDSTVTAENNYRLSSPFFFNPGFKSTVKPFTKSEKPVYKALNWAEFRLKRTLGNYADHGLEVQIDQYLI